MPKLPWPQSWPLPAILAWALAWGVFKGLLGQGVAAAYAMGLACALSVGLSVWGSTWWRRCLIAAGFPLSLLLTLPTLGLAVLPAWAWLVPLALLALVYPLNAWRDAPLFPTPSDALAELPQYALLPVGARVLDAGCGLGHGLQALHGAYPHARLYGLEWSWPLRWICALRCPWAQIRRGDIWAADWSVYDMVYLFQRPESMPRAWDKAARELQPGAWLVSLEFEVPQHTASAHYRSHGGKMVWLYQTPLALS
ncbi:MAG: methyltransferase type 12 [Burkholderiales bacterium RIFCSPLOWO2_12_FULL_61_40]|nr:MAG: methyltransferase type 12 [Burkholderiales bacterium RIFCSPLOWO2_12_FULL_61_40]